MQTILEGAVFLGAWMLYLAPAMIADAKGRDDAFAVTMVNVLLGWTVIGWFAAFVWARHPVSERSLRYVAKRARRTVARATIDAIVARARNRAALSVALQPRLIPVQTRISTRRNDTQSR
jgi:Superinfection immunity protein